jgi:hypothetical protein
MNSPGWAPDGRTIVMRGAGGEDLAQPLSEAGPARRGFFRRRQSILPYHRSAGPSSDIRAQKVLFEIGG